jgi:hypothetical protein
MKQRNLSFQVTNEKVETAILKSICYYLTFTALNESAQSWSQLIKSIASLQGNWSIKLLYYLCSVSAWDETYIRTGTANNGRHFGKMESSFSQRDRLFGQVEIICQIACKFTQQRLGLITFEKSKLEFTIKFQCWKCRSTPQFRNEFGGVSELWLLL